MAINTNLKSLVPRRETFKRRVRLVSGAYYDRKAFPTGEITVYPWDSTMDAWFIERCKQPNRDRSLWDAAARVCDLNGCSIENMITGDVWTILMVSKSIQSECVIDYVATCPFCGTETKESIKVPDDLAINSSKPLDYDGSETFTLPDSKDIVRMRWLTVKDEIHILERPDDVRADFPDHLAHLLLPIVEVGGGNVESRQEIITWYNALSPKDAKAIEVEQKNRYPELKTDLPHLCNTCGKKFTYDLDLNRDFFRAGER